MTCREALIQALVEFGISREEAELKIKASDAFLPEAVPFTRCPVRPGLERAFVESLKQGFRRMDANPGAVRSILRAEIAKQAKRN